MQNSLLQLGHRVVEASWHQKALEPSPYSLDQIQVRAVGWQPVQSQSPRLPLLLALSNHPGGVKRRVVKYYHARLTLSLRRLGQSIQVAQNLPAAARSFDHGIFEPLAVSFQTQRADEVDPPLRAPPASYQMLVLRAL